MAEPALTDRAPPLEEKKPKNDEEFLRLAKKRWERCESAEATNRKMAVEDLKFKAGDQWPADIRAARTIDKRPCLTINKTKTFVHQITNDQRQNRPSINVSPVGDKADPNTAKMLKGLIKAIERQSNADIAYDTGFDSAVSNGWGYWRVITEYEDEDTFDQVIRIDRIRNPFRVYLDPDHQMPDGSDSEWGFISDLVPRDEFAAQFPDADPMAWEEGAIGDEQRNWSTATHVRIAEYFYFETKTRKLVSLENGHVGFEDELDTIVRDQMTINAKIVKKEREVQCKTLKWCKITGKQILEENDWAGKWIPIVKCIGDEVDVEGKVSLAGLIRDAKDPQRMYNFWCTAETELIALAPKAPWVMEEGQVEGHEQRWRDANTKSYPYLLYKGTSVSGKPAPPPQRQPFAGPPAGVVQAKQGAAQDMQAATGIRFDATLQERMYDESGKALRELKRTGDLGNFHYIDNLARSLRHTGRILIDLIPKIYDTPRVLTILREDDKEEQVKIEPNLGTPHQTRPNQLTGKIEKLYNPKLGDYAVTVTIGPSYATKRAEAADSLLAFSKAVPQAGQIAGDLIAKNMDWPGAEEIAARLASMLPPHLLQKGMEDFPPEAKALVGSLQQQMQQTTQQRDKALFELGNQDKDRSIEVQKINKDYDAKMAKLSEDFAKFMIEQQTKVEDGMKALGESEKKMMQMVETIGKGVQTEAGNLAQKEQQQRMDMDKKERTESGKSIKQLESKVDAIADAVLEMQKMSKQKKPVMAGAKRVRDKKGALTGLQLEYSDGSSRDIPVH